MNTIVGKSAGIALLLAAGLMMALFAMGVFSANRVSAAAGGLGITLSSDVPGKAVRITLTTVGTVNDALETPSATPSSNGQTLTPGSDIVVTLPDFVLPSSIAANQVLIDTTGSNGYSGNPSDVSIDRVNNTITLTVPLVQPTNDPVKSAVAPFNIVFKEKSGITNPLYAGVTPEIKVDFGVEDTRELPADQIKRTIEVSPSTAQVRGTEITITGRGFADGSVDVYTVLPASPATDPPTAATSSRVTTSKGIGQPQVIDGVFEIKVNNNLEDNDEEDVFPSGPNGVFISASDGSGNVAQTLVSHKIKASLAFSSSSISPGEELTITVNDAVNGDATDVKFASTSVNAACAGYGTNPDGANPNPDCGITDFVEQTATAGKSLKVQVPSGVLLGSIRVRVTIQPPTPSGETEAPDPVNVDKNITVVAKNLTVSPSTAVPGQEITIQGSGFSPRANIRKVEIDGDNAYASGQTAAADSGGNISITVKVPHALKKGSRKVLVEDAVGRVGQATLTIPEATITLSPKEGLRGSRITVTGIGFPANDLIQLQYDDYTGGTKTARVIGTANSDSTGNFEGSVTVPSFARIGKTQKVTAVSQVSETDVTANTDHSTPEPEVTLTPATTQAGQMISFGGINYAGFISVKTMTINDIDVRPVPAPSTNADGSFTAPGVQVPLLDPGRYTVKVEVGEEITTVFLEISEAPAEQAPAETFASLGDNLEVVWRYNNADGSWASYDPDAPADLNDLTVVEGGNIVWVHLKADQMFQGASLRAGWSLITLRLR